MKTDFKKVDLIGWKIVEYVYYNGEHYDRTDSSEGGIEYFEGGSCGIDDYLIKDDILYCELEKFYQESKQGYSYLWEN